MYIYIYVKYCWYQRTKECSPSEARTHKDIFVGLFMNSCRDR